MCSCHSPIVDSTFEQSENVAIACCLVMRFEQLLLAYSERCSLCNRFKVLSKKDHANKQLAQALVGTMRISVDIHEVLTIQRPVTPKHVGAGSSKINDDAFRH